MPRIAALLVALFLISCGAGATIPSTSAGSGATAAKPAINEQTRGAIQALLRKQHDTMASRDQTAFTATVDPDRLALKRCANESYDIAARQGVGAVPQVGKIEPYLDTYVRAYVQEGATGQRRLFFRQTADGKWVQTEPKDDELGGEKKTTAGDIQIDYWGIDQDVIDALGKGALEAQKVVLANMLSTNRRDPFAIRFYPTRGVSGIQGCTVVGFHLTNVASDPYVRFFRYWFNADGTVSAPTISFMSHEWLHWAQDQFSPGITARLPWWLVEGWPDYVGQSRSADTIKFVVCQTQTPTLKQLEDGADPNGPPELSPQYYAFANSMVEYLYATYGGADAYRKLALAFKDDARSAISFPKALNVTPEQFYDGWKAAAKKRYC
ncbi:MAG TPA: hypothetical protein VFC31_10805 [Candidatus Limnocylindria bacterium]|nr:hypothetical protein [Candidatus Limnocylindria bacterium]